MVVAGSAKPLTIKPWVEKPPYFGYDGFGDNEEIQKYASRANSPWTAPEFIAAAAKFYFRKQSKHEFSN